MKKKKAKTYNVCALPNEVERRVNWESAPNEGPFKTRDVGPWCSRVKATSHKQAIKKAKRIKKLQRVARRVLKTWKRVPGWS